MTKEEFFAQITGKNRAKIKGTQIYKDLVYERFYEVLSNANPIFLSIVGEVKFGKILRKFIASGYAKSKLIWQLSKEFKNFIKDKKILKKLPFIDDLLWLEFSEIKLFMKDCKNLKTSKFAWENRYKISKKALIKSLKYRVCTKEFEKKEKNFILAYYDESQKMVIYREISNFLYDFLKLNAKFSAKNSFKKLAKKYEISKNLKEELENSLQNLCELKILEKI